MRRGVLWLVTVFSIGCQSEDTFRHVHADLRATPDKLDFGDTLLGTPSTVAVTVKNGGDDVLKLCLQGSTDKECSAATHAEPNTPILGAKLESAAPGGTWDVPAGATRQFLVSFAPTSEGPFAATLVLVHNGTNGPSTELPVTGRGVSPHVDLSATALDFGEVTVGQRKDLTLTLTNRTSFETAANLQVGAEASVAFGVASASGEDAPYGQPLAVKIPANGALDVRVFYRPPEEGHHQDTLDVSFCATEACKASVALSGMGTKPVFALLPGQLDFGTLGDGQDATRSFVVKNVGNYALTVLAIDRDPGTPPSFVATPAEALPKLLPPNQELHVDVRYNGGAAGTSSGRIQVSTDAWDDPNTPLDDKTGYVAVNALSVGADINAVPASLSFGTVNVGQRATQNLVLENAGNAALNVQSIQLMSGTQELAIDRAPAFPQAIPPGASVTVVLAYTPNAPGADSATLIVRSDDRDEATLSVPVQGIGGLPNVCTLDVAPNPLNFGLVDRGRTVHLPVRVRSVGAQPCSITGIRLSGARELAIASGAMDVTLNPGESHLIDLTYSPVAYASHTAQLSFNSTDPGAASVTVPVSGTSAPSDVLVVPPALDFNVVPVSCRSPHRSVTVYNTGSNMVTLSSVALDPSTSPEFELTPVLTPAQLPAGASTTIDLRYHPNDLGHDNGVLFITHDAASVPVAVPIDGEGQNNPIVTDSFQQTPTAADILFVIDNSCSMAEEQSGIGSNLGSFLGFAQGNGLDYQIAVTTTDVDAGGARGAFVGSTRVITPSTPNASQQFQINVNQGINGSTQEQGLEAAYLALSNPMISGLNAGFIRPDAMLSVIFVSDEEDQSPRTRAFYESFFRSIKGPGNESRFVASAIVGTTNPECSSPNGVGDYAPRYMLVSQATGGVTESICDANWGQALTNIGFSSFGLRRRFDLSSAPVASTIAVAVNGYAVQSTTATGFQNWTYDAASNSITFAQGAAPNAYDTISITYAVSCLP